LFKAIAHNGAGKTIVCTDDTAGDTTIHTSSDGTTWQTAGTPPTEALDNVVWSASLDLFVGLSVTSAVWFSEAGGLWAAASVALPDITSVITTPDFMVMVGTAGEIILFPSAATDRSSYEYYNLGQMTPNHLPITGFDTGSVFEGGQGKFVYSDTNDKLAVAQYKPPA
jgi:hypothetical protein